MNVAETRLSALRAEFPILETKVRGQRLVYLDNSATTQRPESVLRVMEEFDRTANANVHRGVHLLSEQATAQFDAARERLARFVGAAHPEELLFTKGCTESLNLVAYSYGRSRLKAGDRILLSNMEHHANIVPWQRAAQETGAEIVPIPITDAGDLDMDAYSALLDERVKVVGIVHVSNALGTINPVAQVAAMAHQVGAICVCDGAQGPAHEPVDVQELGVDFYSLTAHKMYGPMGAGALYGRRELLESMPPYQLGGGMIRSVTFEKTTYAGLPDKFEPGTPNVAGVLGFAAAADFVDRWRAEAVPHEAAMLAAAHAALDEIPSVTIHGRAVRKAAVVSFTMKGIHPHDIGTILDQHGVAIRAGHHCCQPLMARLGVSATSRASFAAYNTMDDVFALVSAIRSCQELLG